MNYLVISGESTDWRFLNRMQNSLSQEITNQFEYYQPQLNSLYTTFLVEDANYEEYPPLIGAFGDVILKETHDILLYRIIDGIQTEDPLLVTFENGQHRKGFLLGEGFWKWRSFAYTQSKSFDSIDKLVAKLVQYLASTKKRNRLMTFAESFYYGNAGVLLKAEYFTKNYEFDQRGKLTVIVENEDQSIKKTIPMLLKGDRYEVEISNLPAGDYQYTVTVQNENLKESGSFSVLEFDIEKQTVSANMSSLRQLATDTKGQSYTIADKRTVVQDLINDKRYQTIQKSREENVSLIDWRILMAILILVLAIEWFIRKYNGLI